MFTCPNCHTALARCSSNPGVYWKCPQCGGRAVGIGLVRQALGNKLAADAWRTATGAAVANGRPCPVCARAMKEVKVEVQSRAMVLDVCQRCEFLWFDPTEYESIPAATPKPRVLGDIDESKLPEKVRVALAMERVEELRKQTDQDPPDVTWKTAPALLGLPVEMEGEPLGRKPWLTWILAGLLGTVSFAAFTHLRPALASYGLIPEQAWRLHGLTFLTSFFLHVGLWHLVGNVYFLIIFGSRVEDYLGRWRWIVLVAVAALLGDFTDILIDPRQDVPLVGASGGISGLIAFYALEFPYAKLGMFLRFGFFFRWISIPAWGAFLLWIVLQLFGAWEQTLRIGSVASLAHLGGVAAGAALWGLWRHLRRKPVSTLLPITVR